MKRRRHKANRFRWRRPSSVTTLQWLPHTICEAVRLLLAGLFLFTGTTHAANKYLFLKSIVAYDIVPFDLAVFLSIVLPSTQITLGVLLLVDVWLNIAFVTSVFLLGAYAVAGIVALQRGLDISCGCFGSFSAHVSWSHVGSVLALTAGAVYALMFSRKGRSPAPTSGGIANCA